MPGSASPHACSHSSCGDPEYGAEGLHDGDRELSGNARLTAFTHVPAILFLALVQMGRLACACAPRYSLCHFAGSTSTVLDQTAPNGAVLVQVRAVKRGVKLPGLRSSETRIMPSGSATPPTERIY